MRKMVNQWTKQCLQGQRSKIQTHTHTPLQHFKVPAKRFSHIHIDIVDPLPPSSGFTHLLTIMDRTTHWPEAIPLRDTTTTECARALISTWIARFGVPLNMTSDRGPQFTSVMWSTISSQFEIQLHRTTAYHTQANDLVERFHRTRNASLKARLSSPNCVDELPWVLLGITVVPKNYLQTSSAELVYGESLMIPCDYFFTVGCHKSCATKQLTYINICP